MTFVEIDDYEHLKKGIYSAFAGDKKLIEEYHIVGETLEDCVRDTHNRIIEESNATTMWLSLVMDEGRVIVFLVVSLAYNILYSFGLNIKERELYSDLFFSEVSDLLSNCFSCGLYNKNARGIKYLKRNGMKVISSDSEKTILRLCH